MTKAESQIHFEFDDKEDHHHNMDIGKMFLRDSLQSDFRDDDSNVIIAPPAQFSKSVEGKGINDQSPSNREGTLINVEDEFFYTSICSPKEADMIRQMHMRVISDKSLFVGKGNYGTVYDLIKDSRFCAKHIWINIETLIRGGDLSKLDKKYKPLVDLYYYFSAVKEKRRSYMSQGIIFPAQNTPLTEAAISNGAREVLMQHGFFGMIPMVHEVYTFKDQITGSTDNGLPFVIEDEASILIMERVPGLSVQDIILQDEHDKITDIDVAKIKDKLEQAFRCLHQKGITHQDVSNRNIMINLKTGEPVIIDFGAASRTLGNRAFSEEEELLAVDKVCSWLERYQRNPNNTKKDLERKLGLDN